MIVGQPAFNNARGHAVELGYTSTAPASCRRGTIPGENLMPLRIDIVSDVV
jgi:hypothetical protein